MSDCWHIEDSRTGQRAGIGSYFTKAQAEWQISIWRARDVKGGRPDVHEMMPYLVAVQGQ